MKTTTDSARQDQVFLISGGTSGVGQALATGIAALGAKVVIISRTAESGRQGVAHIAQATGNDRAEFLVADLSRQASIRHAAAEFKRRFDHLHGLANVAGALFFDKQLTRRCRLPAPGRCAPQRAGAGAHHHALGQPLAALPRPRRQPGKPLYPSHSGRD